MNKTTYVFLAGYGNSTGDHWQALWLKQFPCAVWVEQNWDHPRRDEWVSAIDSVLDTLSGQAVIISHSLGGLAFLEWAKRFPGKLKEKVRGAFLVAVPDVNAEAFPAAIQGFTDLSLGEIPVPMVMLASQNDPYASFDRSGFFANSLGCKLLDVGAKGHINTGAGYGYWPEGEAHLQAFLSSIGCYE